MKNHYNLNAKQIKNHLKVCREAYKIAGLKWGRIAAIKELRQDLGLSYHDARAVWEAR
jgi:hypothetical protein